MRCSQRSSRGSFESGNLTLGKKLSFSCKATFLLIVQHELKHYTTPLQGIEVKAYTIKIMRITEMQQ